MSRVLFSTEGCANNGEPYISVCKTGDGFYYASRAGYDSVAFVLYRGENEFCLLKCTHEPLNIIRLRSFTGSMDVPVGIDAVNVVQSEAKEEAGFSITYKNIKLVGSFEVGHMTDERVWLFAVDVNGLEQGERDPQDFREEKQEVVWIKKRDDVHVDSYTQDWKAILIMNYVLSGRVGYG